MGWNPLKVIAESLVKPISEGYKVKQARKQAKETGKAKLALAAQEGDTKIALTDAEWEAVGNEKQDTTWKDEYVTVVCTSPYVFIFLGAVVAAFGNDQLLTGAMTGVTKLEGIGINVGHLCEVVVYAAVGLKIWRGR
jgi:hypothetical protein